MKFDVSKIIELYNNLSDQLRYSILVGVVFLIILFDVFLLLLPQMASVAAVNDQIKKMSDDTQEVLAERGGINLLRRKLKEERLELSSLSDKVRPIQEVPAILSTIASIANEYGVKIDQLVPEKKQQEALASSGDSKYYALPIVIKAHCGYHMFGHFLNKLENDDLYFILKDFIIQNDAGNTNMHAFALTIKIILVDKH